MRLLLASSLFLTLAGAHEIGTTRVNASFRDGRYDIDIATAATPGEPFLRRIKVIFDGVEVTPTQTAPLHLTGTIPAGARNFAWSYGWTFATYGLTVNGQTQWLEGSETSKPVPLGPGAHESRWRTVGRYLVLGFTHILPNGFDHMLFVLGIYLLSSRPRSVLTQVSAFTVAHSITLGLSLHGVVSVPSKVVEPMIAISIAYVAIENLFVSELKTRRVALVFAFGLLHGMGFAGALQDLGLPRSEFLTALLSFNGGVELGQLAVIATAFLLIGKYRPRVVVPVSAAIGCIAVYWAVQRAL
jgi:hydrogenase/urease accessory protein HupE